MGLEDLRLSEMSRQKDAIVKSVVLPSRYNSIR